MIRWGNKTLKCSLLGLGYLLEVCISNLQFPMEYYIYRRHIQDQTKDSINERSITPIYKRSNRSTKVPQRQSIKKSIRNGNARSNRKEPMSMADQAQSLCT